MATIDDIQRVQFVDLKRAEEMTLQWLTKELQLNATSVTLQPKPVSINSFNGFANVDGNEVFFKSHVEPDSVITEYYNSQMLHDAGYNIVLPVQTVHESGQQIAFYPKVKEPVVFDIMRDIETGAAPSTAAAEILQAEQDECKRLLEIYKRNASPITAEQNAVAPVHQLFWHRLTGERYENFYANSSMPESDVAFSSLLDRRFVINGVEQPRTLADLIDEAVDVLSPNQPTLASPAHGDAHFGNVFLQNGRYLYFDPAFGGRFSPLLDTVKPYYHNVFAQWMYFAGEKAQQLKTKVTFDGSVVHINYGNYIPQIRLELQSIKKSELVDPLVSWLKEQDALPHGLRPFELALMCCPLLTMNLTDSRKFHPAVAWAGLSQALQMGNGDIEQSFATTSN